MVVEVVEVVVMSVGKAREEAAGLGLSGLLGLVLELLRLLGYQLHKRSIKRCQGASSTGGGRALQVLWVVR